MPRDPVFYHIMPSHYSPGTIIGLLLTLLLCPIISRAAEPAVPTVLSAKVEPAACRPGFDTVVTFRWEAIPLDRNLKAFVHVVGPSWKIMFQGDHDLPIPTTKWSGHVEYTQKLYVPMDVPDGEYKIVAGLYDRQGQQEIKAGADVTNGPRGEHAFVVGVIKVDSKAAIPKLPPPTLDLTNFKITFDDEFSDLSLSAAGPGGRWFTATKENFGDARFVPQKDGFPFSVEKGILPDKNVLRIEASKKNGQWCSGIMASVDPRGNGFSQKFGYFEIRAKMPRSPGMWPAFWLLGQPHLVDKKQIEPEIDVVEWYGVSPHLIHSTMHAWYPDGRHTAIGDHIAATGLEEDFHRYGVLIDDQFVTYYFDGIEIQKQPTPAEAKVPMYMLVNLAMGSGWPIDKAIDPSYFDVDYVRAYAKK